MEYCDLKKNKQTGEAKGFAYINYSTPQAALMAKDQMDGYEYPVGNQLKVMFAEPLGVKGSAAAANETPAVSAVSYPYHPSPSSYHHLPHPHHPHHLSSPSASMHTSSPALYSLFPAAPKSNAFRIPRIRP